MKLLNKILINRLNTILVDKNFFWKETKEQKEQNIIIKNIFKLELLKLWYKISDINNLNNSTFNFQEILNTLKEKKGGNEKHVPLFSEFPNSIPDLNDILIKRFFWFYNIIFSDNKNIDFNEPETYNYISNSIFELEEFWADPILWRQSLDLFNKWKEKQDKRKNDNYYKLENINIVNNKEQAIKLIIKYYNNLLLSPVSIPEYINIYWFIKIICFFDK